MAARKNKGIDSLPDSWKLAIKSTNIVKKLADHINGDVEMSNTQIKAADILLRKIIPDLARSELTGKDGGPVEWKLAQRLDDAVKTFASL